MLGLPDHVLQGPLKRTMCALFVFVLWQTTRAFAGDYTVAYALQVGDEIETGKTQECEYRHCKISLTKFDMGMYLYFWDPNHDTVRVEIFRERDANCCFFADGANTVSRSARGSLIRLHVYEGHARRRNEFIHNSLLGILNLQFSDMK
jgi:hypothetical protein